MGIPVYNLAACTDDLLFRTTPPAGESSPAGWKACLFSDGVHGAPRACALLADVVVKALEAEGWE